MISRKELERLYEIHSRRMAGELLKDFRDMRRGIDMPALERAVGAGDVSAIVALLHVDEAHLNRTFGALGAYFSLVGTKTIDSIRTQPRPPKVVKQLDIQFATANPRASRWVETATTDIFEYIRLTQIEAVQDVLTTGIAAGEHPWEMALDLAGRVDQRPRARGDLTPRRRIGGVIGFGRMHQQWYDGFARRLETPQGLLYLKRRAEEIVPGPGGAGDFATIYKARYNLINKTSYKIINRALRQNRDLTPEEKRRLLDMYHNNVMLYRGRAIARTETQGAQNAAQLEAVEQMIDKGALRRELVRKRWRAGLDERTRDTHIAANGQIVNIDQDFIVGGARGPVPGAQVFPARERINCRCYVEYDLPFVESVDEIPPGAAGQYGVRPVAPAYLRPSSPPGSDF